MGLLRPHVRPRDPRVERDDPTLGDAIAGGLETIVAHQRDEEERKQTELDRRLEEVLAERESGIRVHEGMAPAAGAGPAGPMRPPAGSAPLPGSYNAATGGFNPPALFGVGAGMGMDQGMLPAGYNPGAEHPLRGGGAPDPEFRQLTPDAYAELGESRRDREDREGRERKAGESAERTDAYHRAGLQGPELELAAHLSDETLFEELEEDLERPEAEGRRTAAADELRRRGFDIPEGTDLDVDALLETALKEDIQIKGLERELPLRARYRPPPRGRDGTGRGIIPGALKLTGTEARHFLDRMYGTHDESGDLSGYEIPDQTYRELLQKVVEGTARQADFDQADAEVGAETLERPGAFEGFEAGEYEDEEEAAGSDRMARALQYFYDVGPTVDEIPEEAAPGPQGPPAPRRIELGAVSRAAAAPAPQAPPAAPPAVEAEDALDEVAIEVADLDPGEARELLIESGYSEDEAEEILARAAGIVRE